MSTRRVVTSRQEDGKVANARAILGRMIAEARADAHRGSAYRGSSYDDTLQHLADLEAIADALG